MNLDLFPPKHCGGPPTLLLEHKHFAKNLLIQAFVSLRVLFVSDNQILRFVHKIDFYVYKLHFPCTLIIPSY